MASSTNTAPGRERVTYVEESYIVRAMEQLAKETGLTTSALTRQATADFVKKMGSGETAVITRDPNRGSTRQIPDRKKPTVPKAPKKPGPKK